MEENNDINNENSILIEENNDINISNILNEKNDLPQIINKFKFSINSWGNYIIEPDLYYQNKYYFFNLNDFKKKLNKDLHDTLNNMNYEKMFEPYKDDLIAYSSTNLEDKPFQRRPKKFFESILRGIYFKIYPDEKNIIEKNKAIILATIIHKINLHSYKNPYIDKYFIGYLDCNPNGGDIDFLYYPFFQYIDDKIKDLDLFVENNNTYIKSLKELINSLKDKIKKYSKEEKEKYILINYLIKIIIPKLKVKEDLYYRGKLNEETEKLLYELYDSISLLILNGLEQVRDSNILFENIEFKDIPITIIKNTTNEKVIFIFKDYINKLNKLLSDEIDSSKICYSFDKSLNRKESEFKEYLKNNIDKSNREKKEFIQINNGKIKESKINISKYNINIPNNNNDSILNSLEKQNLINEDESYNTYNEESKIVDLIHWIEYKKKDIMNKNIKGILITKKLNNNNHFHDKFIIDVIN